MAKIKNETEEGGESLVLTWLSAQIADLISFFNVKLTSDVQVGQLATMIYSEYYYFKLTELMYFFYRFKMGDYEKFYGSFEPQVVLISLKQFKEVRARKLDKYEVKKRQEEKEKYLTDKSSMSREEFVAMIRAEMEANGCLDMELEDYLRIRIAKREASVRI